MRLSAKILKNVNNVNSWVYTNQAFFSEGQSNDLFIQLVDLDQSVDVYNEKSQAFPQTPIRYMSLAVVSGLEATFPSLEDESVIVVAGTQPFPQDKSIWKISLSDSQTPSSGTVEFKLTEDGVSRSFKVKAAVSVDGSDIGGC
jgi:hypothetical protein